ncbi:MAG: hypothetical protein H6779_01165 [Candidatus Nomurabacteria bacterium]|nr:hypothetical protein [Candidatus Nomurabacteria bacterium]USN88039.1 MAG: hypothetical protein H6779_01165 [Candidatus Nomurabacteria bacterium]
MPRKATTKKTAEKKPVKRKVSKVSEKKVTKKPVTKKAEAATKRTAKPKAKSITKTTTKRARKTLIYADNEHSFWVTNGEILNNLVALHDALSKMDEDVFIHHVHDEKHDFADWVEHVLSDNTCAGDLRKAKSPKRARTVVAKHLKLYTI